MKGYIKVKENLVGRLNKPTGGGSDGGIQTAENTLKVLAREIVVVEAEYEEVNDV